MSWKKQIEKSLAPAWSEIARQLESELPGSTVRADFSSALMATFKAGGKVAILVEIGSLDDLVLLMQFLHEYKLNWTVLSGMSNTLIRDGGFEGVAIVLQGADFCQQDLAEGESSDKLTVGAAVATSRIVKIGRTRGWGDAAPLSGVPGYVGGALAMNAGSRTVWISAFVDSITVVTSKGEIKVQPSSSLKPKYRDMNLGHVVVVKATLRFEREPLEAAGALYDQQLAYRQQTQPTGTRNCGSVFRNPEGESAGRLIEAVGLKGVRIHGARISPVHANFIENVGGASASDIEALVTLVQKKVKEEAGVELQRELRIIGTR